MCPSFASHAGTSLKEALAMVNKQIITVAPELAAALRAEGATAERERIRALGPPPIEQLADKPIDERAKATWNSSADIRAEFGKFETFLAYATAYAAGSVKIQGRV